MREVTVLKAAYSKAVEWLCGEGSVVGLRMGLVSVGCVCLTVGLGLEVRAMAAEKEEKLSLEALRRSVQKQYPPYLMALIERDLARGRARQAVGAFDLQFSGRGSMNPSGYYDGRNGDFGLDQALPFWGGNVFAGYRISSGSLADYDKSRTQLDGELRAGIRLNLLRDGTVDARRAALWKARLDREIADPFIQRVHLDLMRNAARSYFQWMAMGMRVGLSEQLLRVAKNRDAAVAEMVQKGQLAPIVKTDNERLVVSRELAQVQARRRFEAASLELSLFFRDEKDEPVVPTRASLPASFPTLKDAEVGSGASDPEIGRAFELRPELRRIQLVASKFQIDQRLAKNNLLPNLDLTASMAEPLGKGPYKDRKETEAVVGLEFRLPLQRNEARGRLETATAELERLNADAQFARDRIVAEIRDAKSAIWAALEQIRQTSRNVDLAEQLEEAERTKFNQGAADLLALQIREQATFDARLLEVDALAEFFRAEADYEAATALGLEGWASQQRAEAK